MKAYRISGTAPFGSQRQPFSYDVTAEDNDAATHKVYSILGSRHRAMRRSIKIESVNEIDRERPPNPRFSITSEKRSQHKAE